MTHVKTENENTSAFAGVRREIVSAPPREPSPKVPGKTALRTFVINLNRSPERLTSMSRSLAERQIDFERVAAVDWRDLSEETVRESYDPRLNEESFKAPLSRAEIACYLSHRLCWQKVLDEDVDSALILEDDVFLKPEIDRILPALVDNPEDWDLVKLYNVGHRNKRTIRSLGHSYHVTEPSTISRGAVGYLVSRAGARKLINGNKPFGRPVDMDIKHWWEKDLRVLVVDPSPIELAPDDQQRSVIEPERVRAKEEGKKTNLYRYALRHIRYVIAFTANNQLNRALFHELQKQRVEPGFTGNYVQRLARLLGHRYYFAAKLLHPLFRLARFFPGWSNSAPVTIDGFRFHLNLSDHIQRNIFYYGIFDQKGVNIIRRVMRSIECREALDIGANVGNHALRMGACCKRLVCFEVSQVCLSVGNSLISHQDNHNRSLRIYVPFSNSYRFR